MTSETSQNEIGQANVEFVNEEKNTNVQGLGTRHDDVVILENGWVKAKQEDVDVYDYYPPHSIEGVYPVDD